MKRTYATKDLAERLRRMKHEAVSANYAFACGIAMWEDGEDIPPRPDDDDSDSPSPEGMRWLGFMVARGLDCMERMKIADRVGGDRNAVQPEPQR